MSDTPTPTPLAMPPHVASGELIESAWGNNVVDELTAHVARLDDLWARRTVAYQARNAALVPTSAGAWQIYNVGSFSINTYACQVLYTVGCEIASTGGGYARLTAGINSVQKADGEARATHAVSESVFLTHSIVFLAGPGTYTMDVYGLTQAAGNMGNAWATALVLSNQP